MSERWPEISAMCADAPARRHSSVSACTGSAVPATRMPLRGVTKYLDRLKRLTDCLTTAPFLPFPRLQALVRRREVQGHVMVHAGFLWVVLLARHTGAGAGGSGAMAQACSSRAA